MSEVKTIDGLLEKMWADYIELNPQAQQIVNLFKERGETVVNDHIALRTFNHPKLCIDVVSRPFLEAGYEAKGEYTFEEKKLYAKHFEHPKEDMPKIFISELKLEDFSDELNKKVEELVKQVDEQTISRFDFTSLGRPWSVSSEEYEALRKESDYAAWVAAIGYRPNHFTVFVNKLDSFETLEELNQFLKEKGFKLNSSGGEIKGSKEVLLEQSSTLADSVEIEFSDKKVTIPSCYFEFAKRYEDESGKLYQGFVAKSADKIFESTSKTQ
ncbi:MAG: succinyldiaminopimelate aminotransferase [Halobacteriovoraceae bacterium]|nr:succinyldiaminopimelate aminotransferase [Halobacteriovoraceae bacterium]|tara:strand:+ start:290089 stop:290898 length:810 start_codon:yes stop_codon:yes gene_type:complete